MAVTESYFNGTLTATATATAGIAYAGGITGQILGTSTCGWIEDCWSHGQIASLYNAGGIAGSIAYNGNNSITSCYSTAAVTCTGTDTAVNNARGEGGIGGTSRSQKEDGGITACVALNSAISSAGAPGIHRILGNNADGKGINNNYAWSGMTVTITGGTWAEDKGAGNNLDGADLAAQPDQAFYEGLGWDFTADTGVWEMDTYGYPKLQWQTEDTARSALGGS